MKEFLKENLVVVAGICVAAFFAFLFLLNDVNVINGGFLVPFLWTAGFPYGLALSFASIRKTRLSPEIFVLLYTVLSEVIYFGVVFFYSWIFRFFPRQDSIALGICGTIGGILLLLLSQLTLKLKFKKYIYLIFLVVLFLLPFAALGTFYTISLWQIAFALMLNEIIKRQQDSFKTNSQKANSF